jgi:hypothetical protein
MEGEDYLEVSVDLERMNKNTNKDYWVSKCDEIVHGVCALLNTFGGKLCIKIENQNVVNLENILDNVLRATEQRLKQFMSMWFNKLIRMPNIQNKQFVYNVGCLPDKVFTVKYHLYLPTLKQVEEIPPCVDHAYIKDMLSNFTEVVQNYPSKVSEFIFGKSVLLTESDSVQFKYVSNEKATRTTIADRIINRCNKLNKTISAFANQSGGQVLYGISNEGIVHGQKLEEKDKREIEAKVTKEINKLIWKDKAMEKGKCWNIEFVPVKDEENNKIASLFIIKISIEALPGGVFVQQPESYQIDVNKEVKLMSFEDWRSRIIYGVRPVPANLNRITWSSATAHKKYFKVIFKLNKLQNQADYDAFNKLARSIKEEHDGTATELFVMFIESVVAYKRGMMKTADEIIDTIEAALKNRPNIDDHRILEFRLLYAKSAIARAKGDYKSSYKYAIEGQQVADCIQPGVLTAWFLNHVAIVEKFLSQQQQQQQGDDKVEGKKCALNHYIKALQYAKASDIERQFTHMIADLEQRVHLFRAITILGNFATGVNLADVTPSNIKAAEDDFVQYFTLVIKGFLPSNYRRAYSLLAECDLRFAQWCQQQRNEQQQQQQQQQQEQGQEQGQEQPQEEVYKTPALLKEAYNKALEGRELSKQCRFEELITYANCRLGRISEMIVKLNFVTTLSKRRGK